MILLKIYYIKNKETYIFRRNMAEKQIKKECEKQWKELTLSDNFIFQKFMLTPENCKKVLSEILGVEVVNVEYPKYEKFIDIRKDSKAIRLDVYVKGDEAIYNVERQCSSSEHIPKRSRFYQDLMDLDIMKPGMYYSELNRSYVIFICTFDYYGREQYKYTFTNKCNEVENLEFGDETTKIVVNTKGTIGDVSQDFKDFINAVNGRFDNSKYSATIKSEVEKIKSNDIWRAEYMNLYLRDQEMKRTGREEGRQEATMLAIKNMLKKLSPEDIIELGYDRELVMSIAEGN